MKRKLLSNLQEKKCYQRFKKDFKFNEILKHLNLNKSRTDNKMFYNFILKTIFREIILLTSPIPT